jgi:hypothetical protein
MELRVQLRFLAAAVAAGLLTAVVPAPGFAQSAPTTEAVREQALVDEFMAAANGDAAARAAFQDRRMAAQARMPKAEFAATLEAVSRTSHDLTLASWTARGGGRLRLNVVAANGKAGRIDLYQDPADPTRLDGFGTSATPAPYPGTMPKAAVSRSELAAAIDQRVRFAAERDDFSGTVLVMKDDEVIYSGAFGDADKAAHRPATSKPASTSARWASSSPPWPSAS